MAFQLLSQNAQWTTQWTKLESSTLESCYCKSDRLCGLGSWLQIQRPGFDSRHYRIFCEVVGLERGPLSLVSTSEELLEGKVVAPV
jgi:hypothetical protein